MIDFKPLITLLAIVNPLAIVPFFIHYTLDLNAAEKRRIIWISSLTVFIVIASSALFGLEVLGFFGISLAGFQVGGSLLLLTSALSMLNAQPAEAKTTRNEVSAAQERAGIAVVPLAIPLLAGPATISTVMLFADQQNMWQRLVLVGFGFIIAGLVALSFFFSRHIERLLGKTGINVMTRLMGLVLAALAIEVMAKGLYKLFPILAQGTA